MNHPLSRSSDPSTSFEAGESVRPRLPHTHTRILMVMNQLHSVSGFPALFPPTSREIDAVATGRLESHRRLVEMERLGLVVRGPARKCQITGRSARTWRIA